MHNYIYLNGRVVCVSADETSFTPTHYFSGALVALQLQRSGEDSHVNQLGEVEAYLQYVNHRKCLTVEITMWEVL
jgi:hypothetical protein